MQDINWDDSLSVDVEEIDDDHRKLVDLFNMLNHSVAKSESADYIEAILDELITCTAWHFKHEERLMLLYNYPQLTEHRDEHNELIASVKQLQQNFLKENRLLKNENIEYLEGWLTGHILGHDMKLGFFLLEAM